MLTAAMKVVEQAEAASQAEGDFRLQALAAATAAIAVARAASSTADGSAASVGINVSSSSNSQQASSEAVGVAVTAARDLRVKVINGDIDVAASRLEVGRDATPLCAPTLKPAATLGSNCRWCCAPRRCWSRRQ